MPRCPNCGEENPERAKFCLNCATSLTPDPARQAEERKVVTVLFSLELVRDVALGWLKALALAVAALSLIRTILGLAEVGALGVIAPLVFLALVLALSVADIRGRLGSAARPEPQTVATSSAAHSAR